MFRFGDDDDYTTLDNAPGASGWFDLGDTVGLGRANRRHDMLKVETLLANAGDLDLSKTGGAMGYGLYTVDDAVRKFQGRNGLKVDGWLRPDGPTIAKLKDQLGGVLGGYPAPTPEQVDLHHRLRNRGEEGLLAVEPPNYKLLPNPWLPPVDRRTRGSNESWVNWTARNRSDLSGASEMLTTYIKNFGDDGIVQARDFVEQWDQIKPGQGSDAIRQILALIADPWKRERFLGGRLPQMPPYGVLKPGAEQRIAALTGTGANNIVAEKDADDPELVYDPVSNTYVWKESKRGAPYVLHAVGDDPARKLASANENTGIEVAQNGAVLSDTNRPVFGLRFEMTPPPNTPQPNTLPPESPPRGKIGIDEEGLPPLPQGPGMGQAPRSPADARRNAATRIPSVPTDLQLAQATPMPDTAARKNFDSGPLTDDFKNPIFGKESGGERKPLEAVNSKRNQKGDGRQEVLGMYQLSRDALVDAGFKNPDGSWKPGNALGVTSDEGFLRGANAREVQEKAMEAVMRRNEAQLKAFGADAKIGTEVDGIKEKFPISDAGLAAAAHRAGANEVKSYLELMEQNGWDSKKAVQNLSVDNDRRHRAVETRLREFSRVQYRTKVGP